ncbi:hypothetical protein [Pseudonocardia phyllosphaerae]|uniref:hypothetical protein n=1 Tax=Pseudonocardia phyllosphaerae TaxID=3390502 RepID=UPI00397A1CDE
MATVTYHANATRDGRYWLIHVPEVERYTQARTVDEIESMARDLVVILTEQDPVEVEVEVAIELPHSVRTKLDLVEQARATERAARTDAATQLRSAAVELKRTGMSVRELGKVLGISYQRAAQLTSRAHESAS